MGNLRKTNSILFKRPFNDCLHMLYLCVPFFILSYWYQIQSVQGIGYQLLKYPLRSKDNLILIYLFMGSQNNVNDEYNKTICISLVYLFQTLSVISLNNSWLNLNTTFLYYHLAPSKTDTSSSNSQLSLGYKIVRWVHKYTTVVTRACVQ